MKGNISFNENGSRRVDSAEIRQFRLRGKHLHTLNLIQSHIAMWFYAHQVIAIPLFQY